MSLLCFLVLLDLLALLPSSFLLLCAYGQEHQSRALAYPSETPHTQASPLERHGPYAGTWSGKSTNHSPTDLLGCHKQGEQEEHNQQQGRAGGPRTPMHACMLGRARAAWHASPASKSLSAFSSMSSTSALEGVGSTTTSGSGSGFVCSQTGRRKTNCSCPQPACQPGCPPQPITAHALQFHVPCAAATGRGSCANVCTGGACPNGQAPLRGLNPYPTKLLATSDLISHSRLMAWIRAAAMQ